MIKNQNVENMTMPYNTTVRMFSIATPVSRRAAGVWFVPPSVDVTAVVCSQEIGRPGVAVRPHTHTAITPSIWPVGGRRWSER